MSQRLAALFALALCVAALGVGCKKIPLDAALIDEQNVLAADAQAIAETFKDRDPTIRAFFDHAHAYIVFPQVQTGPAGSGLATAEGVVFKHGRQAGYAALRQGNPTADLDGQSFAQIIFFETQAALDAFQADRLRFAPTAEAVAAKPGAAAQAGYIDGLAAFTTAPRGLRFEASLKDQRITTVPTEAERIP
ncbi:MAG: hypothetical protein AAF823_15085 [Planctomycetota bacterium]